MIQEVNLKAVQETLEAILSLLTQPIEQQDLPTSLKAVTTAIALINLPVFALLLPVHGVRSAGDIIVVVLGWMLLTAIVSRPECRSFVMTRNLALLSFWLIAMVIIVFLATIIFPDPLGSGIRFLSTTSTMALLIPFHMRQCVRLRSALWLTPALWLTVGFLAWRIIY